MLTQTKEVRDAWRASQRTLDIKVAVNGKTYNATDINSLKYDSGAYTGDTFAIGSTYSNSVQLEFSHLIENLKLGMEVLPSIGIKTSKGYIYEPLGVFIISSEIKMDRNNNLTSISASDRFCGLEGTYKSKLAYPARVLDVIAEICAQSGVKANVDDLARLPHQADLPHPITGQTYRKALGWIAQLYAGYATFDRHGLFTIRTIAEPNYELDPSQYEQAGLTKNEAPYKISGIQCQTTITTKTRDGEDTDETKTYQVGDTNGSQIKLENNIMTPDRLTNIWEQLKDVTFYPFSLNWFGNPAIEAGDWLKLQDKQGNKFIVPNNSYTLDFNGGLSATSKADQTSSTDSGIAWEGTFSQTIRELQGRKAPDGTVIFPPSVTEPPTNAKPNDVWFKQNGNLTELWVFTKQEDGTGKWIRRDLTPDEIKKQVQEAQDGLKDAKKEIADNLAKADKDIAELNASIGNQNSKIEGLNTNVNTVVIPKVTDITNQVSDVVTKVSEQKNIVTGLQNQATQQDKDISKITTDVHGVTVDLANLNGDVNQTKATVQGLQTTLGNAQGDIAQIKVDAKKLETSLSGKVDNSTYANFVSATNNALNAKLVASDLNGYAKTTDVQATANGLQVNINSVSGKLDNLVIGNRNLVRNSGFPINTDYWNGPEIANHAFYYSDTKPLFLLKNNSSEKNYAESAYFPLKRNTTYVASFKGFSSVNVSSCDVFILARKYGENNKYTTVEHVVDAKRLSPSEVEYIKDLIFNSGENDEAYIRFDHNGSTNNETSWLFFTEVKIEEGNKSTAWTPDPEDEQDRINGITSQLSAKITANSQQFSSYYTKTDIDKQRSSVQSQITQNATGLQSVVAKVDNIRIGGTNLIRDSLLNKYSHGAWISSGEILWHDNSNSVEIKKGDLIQIIPVEPNTTYTFSFGLTYQDMTDAWANQFFFVEYRDQECTTTTPNYIDHRWAGDQFPNTAGRKDKKLTFTTQADCHGLKMYIRQESTRNNPLHIFQPKLEVGNQATDWSPAPEDKANQSDYSALSQTVQTIRSEVTNNINGLQSQITQNANNINLKVNAIGDLSNICLNPNFMDGSTSGWENISSSVGNTISPSKFYGCLSIRDGFYGNMFPVATGDKYYFSIYAWQDQSLHNFSIGFAYLLKDGSWNWQHALTFSPNESGREKTGTITIPSNVVKARIWVQIDAYSDYGHWWFTNVNVRKNDTLAQINVAAGTTLIQNDKIYMDASSTVFSGKAFIPDAAITNISADKINTGTLDAGRINVINLNANNITTGTINGANLKINLNSGEILFQKGRIGSTNGYLNIDIDSGKMSVTNSTNSGVFFENGELYLSDNWAYGTNSQPKYGVIRRSIHSFTLGECGAEIASPSGISLQTMNYDGAFGAAGFLDQTKNGASVAIDRNGQALINAKQVGLTGGTFFSDNKFIPSKRRPRIVVGTDADASGLNLWGWGDPLNHVASRIVIDASYVHFPNSYNTTTGSAPNLYIASDGAIVRSTSASKYKTDIKRSYSTEYGEKLLNLPTAIWTDKGQKERYEAGKRHIKPEKYFGMIAEDLADAGLDLLVSRNPLTHEIEGIQYERIAPALLPVIKKLKDKVDKLEEKINE
ncbi:MAG: gp58-like family protein [Lactobacillus johnsonii]|nr:gp58-like family protein [Lactobacillus johnsonii]